MGNNKLPAGWKIKGDSSLYKKFEFKNFTEAMNFVNIVARLSEKANHHPDIYISYNKVNLTLTTHSEGSITDKDYKLAQSIEDEAS